jgi:hypothetical protein
MRIGELRTLIEGKGDEEIIFLPYYDIDEANEHIQNNMLESYDDSKNLTQEEWKCVVEKLGNDDGVWTELNESFRYYIEQVIEKREKGEADVNSK